MAALPDAGANEVLYVLNFRYSGGGGRDRNYRRLHTALRALGWRKVQGMTCLFVQKIRRGERIDEDAVEGVLRDHAEGANVLYDISIGQGLPPNQRGDPVQGIRGLFQDLED